MSAPTRRIGSLDVSALGMGVMPVSQDRIPAVPHGQAIATVHAALDAGITFFDTADTFAPSWDTMGHNEKIVAEALRTWSGDTSQVVVATKGGITRGAGERWGRDGSAVIGRASCRGRVYHAGSARAVRTRTGTTGN